MGAFRVIRPSDRLPDTASGAMRREAAVSDELVGAGALWFGYVELAPGAVSAVHHHGESESAIYVISGSARFWSGPELSQSHDAQAGGIIRAPPPGAPPGANRSDTVPAPNGRSRLTLRAGHRPLPAPERGPARAQDMRCAAA